MLECDYPHSDSTWPDTVNLASKWLGHLSDEVQHKITVGNASGSTTSRPPTRRRSARAEFGERTAAPAG